MTMPHLMNCDHSEDGWCLDCVGRLHEPASRMTLSDFAAKCRETAIYPPDKALEYLALGLASEAGEVAGKVKKIIRDGHGDADEIAKEIGDVLWYAAMLSNRIGKSLDTIAEFTLAKLADRKARGKIGGSGDTR